MIVGVGGAAAHFTVTTAESFHEMIEAADKFKEAGIHTHASVGALPESITPIHSLILKSGVFPFQSGDYKPIERGHWQADDWRAFGRWAIRALNVDRAFHANPQIYKKHVDRFQMLGISPGYHNLKRHFGRLTTYRRELGLSEGRVAGQYDTWSDADFIGYAYRLSQSLRRKAGHSGRPNDTDYENWAQKGKGPSPAIIITRMGITGISELNDLIGYPHIRSWEDDDYINWGVRVMQATPGITITRNVARILSRRDRGPSDRHIASRFGMHAFQERVAARLEANRKANEEPWITLYQKLTNWGKVTASDQPLTPQQQIIIAMRHELAKQCIRDAEPKTLDTLARSKNGIISEIRSRTDKNISAAEIEMIAFSLGMFDYLWPPDLNYLRITPEELEEERRIDNEAHRGRRRSRA